MAWCYKRNGIRRTCPGDRTNGVRVPDIMRDFGIRTRLAVRDLSKFRPNTYLKCRSAHVERQCEDGPLAVHSAQYRIDGFFKACAVVRYFSSEELFLQLVFQFDFGVTEADRTNTPAG